MHRNKYKYIYIYIYMYMNIYIYMCVCVCVCPASVLPTSHIYSFPSKISGTCWLPSRQMTTDSHCPALDIGCNWQLRIRNYRENRNPSLNNIFIFVYIYISISNGILTVIVSLVCISKTTTEPCMTNNIVNEHHCTLRNVFNLECV